MPKIVTTLLWVATFVVREALNLHGLASYILLSIGIILVLVSVCLWIIWFKSQKTKNGKDIYIIRLNQFENALTKYRQLSDDILTETLKYRIEDYVDCLKDDIAFKEHIIEGKHNAVLQALTRGINPKLGELQANNAEWSKSKAKLIELSTKLDDKLNRDTENYMNIYQTNIQHNIIMQLSTQTITGVVFDGTRGYETKSEVSHYEQLVIGVYGQIIRRIKRLRNKRRFEIAWGNLIEN